MEMYIGYKYLIRMKRARKKTHEKLNNIDDTGV